MASSRRTTITAFRIVNAAYANRAFDGEGARLAGGRWNSPGLPAIYTAESISLAALELLVHLENSAVLDDYLIIPCRFPRRLVKSVAMRTLPPTWRDSPPDPAVRRMGDDWLRRRTSVVLAVPSAIIEGELNYVINPLHEDFGRIAIESPRSFALDHRLGRTS